MKAHDHLHSQNGYSGLRRQYQTYVRVGGEWRYLYRAVDGTGQTIDFLLSAKRDKKAAKRFFRQALRRENTRNPREVVTDRLKPVFTRCCGRAGPWPLALPASCGSWPTSWR